MLVSPIQYILYLDTFVLNATDHIPVYIGHDKFDPIWEELNRRQAVVHLHGTQTPSSTPYPHEFLGLPITEVKIRDFPITSHSLQIIRSYSSLSL